MRLLCASLICACVSVPLSPAYAVTWHVPTDAPTIQAGIDSASAGDTVLVACGTYDEHDIILKSGISLLSETGEPDCVTIDALSLGRVLYCEGADSTLTVRGFTITGGYVSGEGNAGGGMCCIGSAPRIARCSFVGNIAEEAGGGMNCSLSPARIWDCEFRGNFAGTKGGGMKGSLTAGQPVTLTNVLFVENSTADDRECNGGGIWASGAGMVLTNVTFLRNSAWGGGAVWCRGRPVFDHAAFIENSAGWGSAIEFYVDSHPMLTHSTFVSNSFGSSIYCDARTELSLENSTICFGGFGAVWCDVDAVASLVCCNLYGNGGGDYVDCTAGQLGINGNISEDPLFCDPENGNFYLQADSPCAPFTEPNPECDLIGAFPVGCGTTAVAEPLRDKTSWSSLKALYR